MKGPECCERLCKRKYATFVKEIMPISTLTTSRRNPNNVEIFPVIIEVLHIQ